MRNILQHVVFWPSINNSIFQAFLDWPESKSFEEAFLRQHLKWKAKIVFGVMSKGNKTPDFVIKIDADDEESPFNMIAQTMVNLLP
jgi:hypothetical protein